MGLRWLDGSFGGRPGFVGASFAALKRAEGETSSAVAIATRAETLRFVEPCSMR
jgi:hypothetical protein